MDAMGSFEAVVYAFSQQVAELREATLLRVDDATRRLHEQDVEAIEATVRALEHKLQAIKSYVQRESEAIPQVEAVVAACQLQQQHLQHIAGHLPTYLPSLRSPELASVKENNRSVPNAAASAAPDGAAAPKKRAPAPRRYITAAELASASSYMRGRLTADRINAAIDEMAVLAEANVAMVAAARRNRAVGPDKKQAMWLLVNIANHTQLKGRNWVLESDMKNGTAVRLDKTGKSLLMLLRHLGRLQEVRVPADGTTHLVYLMLPSAEQ
ncbi:hypothetical protein D9Q98_001269 [Chlorella vulgaris]|uniref:Spindle and kinetochore-associated protein 1 homolog n=1 Tax=Chlorella vulgaris TaxID=3077 RepID=A0A9D4U005_CHLVU|nr:hypothetical protein D9Q98_001269 [Chlorella vulgaris]